VAEFGGGEVASWLRSVDRALLDHAWQDAPFIGPANVVFVYLLARDASSLPSHAVTSRNTPS